MPIRFANEVRSDALLLGSRASKGALCSAAEECSTSFLSCLFRGPEDGGMALGGGTAFLYLQLNWPKRGRLGTLS